MLVYILLRPLNQFIMRSFTNIPIALCRYALVHRKLNHVKLFIYLKLNSDGYMPYSKGCFKHWAQELEIHEKTIKSCFEWLLKRRWITVNSKRGAFRVISYRCLSIKMNFSIKTGYYLESENLKYFQGLCSAIVIVFYLGKKRWLDKQSGNNKGFPITNCSRSYSFYPMANSYLAKCLGVSIATACRYKQNAEEYGYIETKSNYRFLEDRLGKVKIAEFPIYLIALNFEEMPNRLRQGRKYIKWVEADLIKPIIRCKKKGYFFKGKN